jgi:acetyltransferase-like isoleucine patch superfamily enzyme
MIYGKVILYCEKLLNLIGRKIYRPMFLSHGKKVRFFPWKSDLHYWNISVGNDVFIGRRAMFLAAEKKIIIGNKVLFGPGVTIVTGDHNFSKIGSFMIDNRVKEPGDDEVVIIEDDVWIGANVTILKGVTIGRGSIIAAGALVFRSIPPYTIYGGVPAKKLRNRFTMREVLIHESMLFAPGERLDTTALNHLNE